MIAEQLHDALTGLPEEMLTPLEAIRKKCPFPWKAVSATAAACLVLCAGLLLFPGQAKSGAGSAPESAYNQYSQADPQEHPAVDKDMISSTDTTEEDEEDTTQE